MGRQRMRVDFRSGTEPVQYVDRELWVDRTPRQLTLIGLFMKTFLFFLAFVTTLSLAVVCSVLAVLWVTFISIQGVEFAFNVRLIASATFIASTAAFTS